jgi:hypothetical protein
MAGLQFGRALDPFKSYFFDRARVLAAADKATVRALSKAGAYVRTAARSSLRRRKRPSKPGTPPSVHADGFASLKTIFFAFEPGSRSVVVGPVKINGARTSPTVPELHEFGGVMAGKMGIKKYPARPYMRPALMKELPKFRDAFKGAIGAAA